MSSVRVHEVYADADDVVDVHWKLRNGQVLVERRKCPPSAVQDARLKEARKSDA